MNISKVNGRFTDNKLRKEFFIKIALIRTLQIGLAIIKDGYVEPKEGKEREFAIIINQTLLNAGFTSKELEGEIWNKRCVGL